MKFSENKLNSDYEVIDSCPTKAVKLSIAAEYGLTSCKAAEIEMGIVKAMRELRREKTEFSANDIKWFYRLNVPSTYKRAIDYYKLESFAFINYLKKYYENKYGSVFMLPAWKMTMGNKAAKRDYEGIVKYLNEYDPAIIANVTPEQELLNKICEILLTDMKPFHDEYISRVKESAINYYEKLPALIKNAKEYYETLKKKYYTAESKYCELYNSGNRKDAEKLWPGITLAKKNYMKAEGAYKMLTTIKKKYATIDAYINKRIEDAEAKYNMDVNSVADRVKERNFNIDKLTVADIKNDPKFFEMVITDGEKKMHARSIWAAEYSDKVTAHYRFIITNCK